VFGFLSLNGALRFGCGNQRFPLSAALPLGALRFGWASPGLVIELDDY